MLLILWALMIQIFGRLVPIQAWFWYTFLENHVSLAWKLAACFSESRPGPGCCQSKGRNIDFLWRLGFLLWYCGKSLALYWWAVIGQCGRLVTYQPIRALPRHKLTNHMPIQSNPLINYIFNSNEAKQYQSLKILKIHCQANVYCVFNI